MGRACKDTTRYQGGRGTSAGVVHDEKAEILEFQRRQIGATVTGWCVFDLLRLSAVSLTGLRLGAISPVLAHTDTCQISAS